MRYSLLTQLALIGVSLVIVFSFIKPMFAEIKVTQDEIAEYNQAIEDASEFNTKLQSLISVRDSLSEKNKDLLANFLPSEIDTVKIMRDIESIFLNQKIAITTLATAEEAKSTGRRTEDEESDSGSSEVGFKDYEVAFTASYDELKEILALIERSESLLEVSGLKFTVVPEGDEKTKQSNSNEYTFALTLRAYGLTPSPQ